MGRMPKLKPKTVLAALLRAGFYIYHQRGSHVQLRNLRKPRARVTIPFHASFDLPPEVVVSIIRQAEMTRDEFIELL